MLATTMRKREETVRLSLEVSRQGLTVDEHITRDNAHIYPLGQNVEQSRLASPRLSHQRRQLARCDEARDVSKELPISFSRDGYAVVDILPGEHIRLRGRLHVVECCRCATFLVDDRRGWSTLFFITIRSRLGSLLGLGSFLEERHRGRARRGGVVLGEDEESDGEANAEGNDDAEVL